MTRDELVAALTRIQSHPRNMALLRQGGLVDWKGLTRQEAAGQSAETIYSDGLLDRLNARMGQVLACEMKLDGWEMLDEVMMGEKSITGVGELAPRIWPKDAVCVGRNGSDGYLTATSEMRYATGQRTYIDEDGEVFVVDVRMWVASRSRDPKPADRPMLICRHVDGYAEPWSLDLVDDLVGRTYRHFWDAT